MKRHHSDLTAEKLRHRHEVLDAVTYYSLLQVLGTKSANL